MHELRIIERANSKIKNYNIHPLPSGRACLPAVGESITLYAGGGRVRVNIKANLNGVASMQTYRIRVRVKRLRF